MERNNAGLSSLPDDFYTQLSEYVNSLITEYKKTGSPNDMRKLENTLKVAKDVFERRIQKILVQALRAGKENSPESMGLVEIEKTFYDNVSESVSEINGEFEKVLTGERPVQGTAAAEHAEKALNELGTVEDEEQDLNMVLVRILQEVPKFVSSDMQEYGPFQPRDLIRLPEKEANLLIQRGFAEKV